MRRFAAVTLALAAVALIACSGSSSESPTSSASPTPDAPPAANASPAAQPTAIPAVTFLTTQIQIDTPQGARSLDVEVATTPVQTERGLGYRDALPEADAGMIFDLLENRIPSFWMKGMRFPLDMVWIGADGRVAGVKSDIAPQPGAADAQLKRYSPSAPVRYVLELNAGGAARLGIATGGQISFALP